MTQLPSSIEQYLQEAGFSPTELLVLKRLLEGNAMTLRELAAKTGKSTGVLDQATKKLIDKRIVTKEAVNDTQKYAISSLEAIQRWVEKDMIDRHTELKRKKENFDAFLATVKHRKDRPEIESFEGEEGMKKAFKKLLAIDVPEWIHFAPAVMREADDPLAQFRVELFRERRGKKIFMRALTPDVPLGHRYQSRDVYEYRQTRFVPPDEFPVTFEQYIVGDTVACIDTVENKASFVHFPQLAESQKKLFGVMWGNARKTDDAIALPTEASNKAVPLKTALVSGLREFCLGKKAVALGLFCLVLSLLTTHLLYVHNTVLNTERVRERVMAIAATAAPQFSYVDVRSVVDLSDVDTQAYEKIVDQLQDIKEQNPNIEYAYIMRSTDNPFHFRFVADADSADLKEHIDLNEDGLINDVVGPGQLWIEYDPEESAIHRAYNSKSPTADLEPTYDEWGVWIAGHAPIFDERGNVVAILGVDMFANSVSDLTMESFNYGMHLIIFFIIFLVVGYFSFLRGFSQDK